MPPVEANIAPLDPADKRAPPPTQKICVRCKEKKSAILLQTAAFCHECFQYHLEGKVRQSLEQSRLCTYLHRTEYEEQQQQVKAGESSSSSVQGTKTKANLDQASLYPCKGRVALGFSGGAASRALLHNAVSRLLTSDDSDGNRGASGRTGKLQEVHALDVIYVDDSEVIAGAVDRTEDVRQIVSEEGGEELGLHFWPMKLSDVFEDELAADCTAEYACE
jgi:hypothetical protein